MPDWLIWFIVLWVVCGCGAGGRWSYGRRRDRRLERREDEALEDATLGADRKVPSQVYDSRSMTAARSTTAVSTQRAQTAPPETPLKKLQRQFVEGAISLDRYEEEIDRLDTLE